MVIDRRTFMSGFLSSLVLPNKKISAHQSEKNNIEKEEVLTSIMTSGGHELAIINLKTLDIKSFKSTHDIHDIIWNKKNGDIIMTCPLWGKSSLNFFSRSQEKFIHNITPPNENFEFTGHGCSSLDGRFNWVGLSQYIHKSKYDHSKGFVAKIDMHKIKPEIVEIYPTNGIEPQAISLFSTDKIAVLNSGSHSTKIVGASSLTIINQENGKILAKKNLGTKGTAVYGHITKYNNDSLIFSGGKSNFAKKNVWDLTPSTLQIKGEEIKEFYCAKDLKGVVFNIALNENGSVFNIPIIEKVRTLTKEIKTNQTYSIPTHFGFVISKNHGFILGAGKMIVLFDAELREAKKFTTKIKGTFGAHAVHVKFSES